MLNYLQWLSTVQPMPGAGLPLEYIPDSKDEAFVREHLPNPLLKDDIDFCGWAFDPTSVYLQHVLMSWPGLT